jgi:nucleotide-binding universal stress UspA family protein
MRKILVGTDTSASADLAVGEAARLAEQSGAELLVLHVRPESSVRDAVDPKKSADPGGYLAGLERRFPAITVHSWAESGDPAERLVAIAEQERVETDRAGQPGDPRLEVAGPRQRAEPRAPPRAVLGDDRGHARGAVSSGR